MAQYCDSAKLEYNWFRWILASEVPDLELYRQHGLLWTKVIGQVKDSDGNAILKNGRHFPDAMAPRRLHCIATANPIYFESNLGRIPSSAAITHNRKNCLVTMPSAEDLSLLSDSIIHNSSNIFIQYDEVIPELHDSGYIKEMPVNVTWHAMLEDINKMCSGIAVKFKMPSEEETFDLANEALLTVTNKLKAKKLVYTPGRAPVFNLLTTTIHRCMFSIMNRRNNQRNNLNKLINDVKQGSIPTSNRSFRTQTKPTPNIKTHK